MTIAIPVKMNKENPPVSPLFGKAKWFVLIEKGEMRILPNAVEGGREVIEWLDQLHVDTIIMQEMGKGPYSMIQKLGNMKVYHCGFERILLDDVLKKFSDHELPLLNDKGMSEIIAHHETKHSHDNHHHADHHHH